MAGEPRDRTGPRNLWPAPVRGKMSDMTKETAAAPDPFDPATLRLDQSFADTVGAKRLLTTVSVRRPNRQDFSRVHPSPQYRLTPAAIIELREEREVYLVEPSVATELPGEFTTATLYTAINRQGVVHIWPVKLPGPDGKHNEWHRFAAEAAEIAMTRWVGSLRTCRWAPTISLRRSVICRSRSGRTSHSGRS